MRAVRAKTRAQQAAFLASFAQVGVITEAAKLSGVDRSKHYEWIDDSADYRERFAAAHEQACDRLEAEMVRRAVEGWDEPVFGKLAGSMAGEGLVGYVRKYSDRMLEIALKARRPTVFRERATVEHEGRVKIEREPIDPKKLTDEQLAVALAGAQVVVDALKGTK